MQSDERLKIDTPEQVTLELPLAGIGSRFLAVAIDTVLQAAIYLAGIRTLIVGARFGRGLPAMLQMMGPAAAILFTFCVYWGYFALFEFIWSGRTPGKRIAGIRVIKESERFPPAALGYVYNLSPALASEICAAFLNFQITDPELKKQFSDSTHFVHVSFKNDFDLIRRIDDAVKSAPDASTINEPDSTPDDASAAPAAG